MNRKEVLVISISIFLTIVAWVMIDIYHIQQRINESVQTKPYKIPNYTMDKKIIDLLRDRE